MEILVNYRADIKASKSLSNQMIKKFRGKTIPNKKKFNKKKSRRSKKIKYWQI